MKRIHSISRTFLGWHLIQDATAWHCHQAKSQLHIHLAQSAQHRRLPQQLRDGNLRCVKCDLKLMSELGFQERLGQVLPRFVRYQQLPRELNFLCISCSSTWIQCDHIDGKLVRWNERSALMDRCKLSTALMFDRCHKLFAANNQDVKPKLTLDL
ncbi:unannotated protein [freshwater metagenome]|uniref:Unannotated protein n=1 Tax=freshwater metagenome TaxID=449393 RepID=A0A6J6KZP3_9ZZZZ